MNYFLAKVTPVEIRKHLQLSTNWPVQRHHKGSGDESVNDLINEIITCLLTHPSQDWMYDVVFFASNFFLTLLSTQLYQVSNESIGSRDDLFMDFIYIIAEEQLRGFMKVDGDISHTLSASLVKALMLNVIENLTPTKSSLTTVLVKSIGKSNSHSKSKQPFSAKSAASQADIFSSFGMFLQNPLKALVSLVRLTTGLHIGDTINNRAISQISSSTTLTVSNYRQLSKQPVAEKSLKILLILLHNKRYINGNVCNPMREAFCLLYDEQLDGDSNNDNDIELMGKSNRIDRRIHCDFKALSSFLVKTLPDPSSAQLLYSFIQLHPTFMDNLTIIDNFDAIITALLNGLYNSCNTTNVDHLYILVVVALMITQDSKLRSKLAKTYIRAPWYTERILGDVSLVDLTVLCVMRSTMYALYHLKGDQYLLSNCYAILLNIAPYLIGIHTYSAERIVTIIKRIGIRIVKESASATESVEKDYLLRCMKETTTVLIRIVGVALRPLRRASNVHLVYALIHENSVLLELFLDPIIINLGEDNKSNIGDNEKSLLPASSSNPQLNNSSSNTPRINSSVNINNGASASDSDDIGSYNTNCLQPTEIASLIKHYLKTLESSQDQLNTYMTAAKAVQLLRNEIEDEQEAILNIRANELSSDSTGRLDDDDAMTSMTTFTYEEGGSPEDFFVPFTWTNMIRNSPEMFWFLESVTLFNPFVVGLIIEDENVDNSTGNNNNNV